MIKPDIIVSWPRNCDYPLWREYIRNNRRFFNEIIIAFTETHQGYDYRKFIRDAMFLDHVNFIDPRPLAAGEDWRNVAINSALLHSYNAEWVWFTEQDFIVLNNEIFWGILEIGEQTCDIIATYQGDRMHPCNIMVKRTLLNKTSRNFSIIPNKSDHFSIFQKEIEALQCPIYKHDMGYYHFNGLSHNMTLLERGEAPNYQIDKFKEWLQASLSVSVPLHEHFVTMAKRLIAP